MDYTGVRFFNDFYAGTPEAIFKIVELVVGAGTWSPVLGPLVSTSGPYSFFIWCTLGSWILVLLTYSRCLFKLSKLRMNDEERRNYSLPNLGDLVLNAAIAVTYIPAIVVFGVYSFPSSPILVGSRQTFVLIMALLTFVVHGLHASTLALYFTMGDQRWEGLRRWIWQRNPRPGNVETPIPQSRPAKFERTESQPGRYEQPLPIQATAPQQVMHEIYQDLS